MSTLTKEWLLKTIAELEEERDATPGVVNEDAAMALAAMKLALASLEAEPVAWRYRFVHTPKSEEHGSPFTTDWVLAHSEDECNPSDCFERQPLYTAPPAPVSVPDAATAIRACMEEFPESVHDIVEKCAAIAENACCAAMLQGAEPVTTANKLPDDFDFDRFNDVVWLEAVASNPHMHSLTTSTIAMVALELNKRMNLANSPAIPDGWVMAPVEPTEDMIVNGFESEPDESFSDEREWEAYDAMSGCQQAAHRAKLCWAAMIAAAPKPEVK